MKKLLRTLKTQKRQANNNTFRLVLFCELNWLNRTTLTVCLALLFFLTLRGQADFVRFVDSNGALISTVDIARRDSDIYLPILALQATFDSNLTYKYNALTRRLSLNLKDQEIQLGIGSALATVQSSKIEVILKAKVKLIEGLPHLPLSFFTQFIPQVFEYQVVFNQSLSEILITEQQYFQHEYKKQKRVVIIDPGHGGDDIGCESLNGIREKNVVLDLAKRIQKICQTKKITILLTRNDDNNYRPSQRIQITNQQAGLLFLSLHCNSTFSDKISGMEVWINNQNGQMQVSKNPDKNINVFRPLLQDDYLDQSRQLAKIVQTQLTHQSSGPIQIRENPLAILSSVYMPALRLELGYLSNQDDEAKLQSETIRQQIAVSISEAIIKFLMRNENK